MAAAFDPAAETARYVDSLGAPALEKAHAYTNGANLLLVLGVVVAVLLSWLIVRLKVLDRVAERLSHRGWALSTFLTGAAFLLAYNLLQLPWTIFVDWKRQRDFGLSHQPLGDFLGQWALSQTIAVVLGGLFLLGIYTLIRKVGSRWWIWGAAFTGLVSVVMLLVTPTLLMPMFNKFEPVPQGPVRVALEKIADDVNIPHDRIFMFDGSRQSQNFTANVAGVGPSARIAISDVAFKTASLDEVRAVTGHEAGHYKLGHVWRFIVVMPLLMALLFYLTQRLFTPAARLLGSTARFPEPRGLPVFAAILSVLSLFTAPFLNGLTRMSESEADTYSLQTVGLPDAFATALLKTAEYRYPRPAALQELLFYDHPSVEKRIRRAMEWKAIHQPVEPPAQ